MTVRHWLCLMINDDCSLLQLKELHRLKGEVTPTGTTAPMPSRSRFQNYSHTNGYDSTHAISFSVSELLSALVDRRAPVKSSLSCCYFQNSCPSEMGFFIRKLATTILQRLTLCKSCRKGSQLGSGVLMAHPGLHLQNQETHQTVIYLQSHTLQRCLQDDGSDIKSTLLDRL